MRSTPEHKLDRSTGKWSGIQ
jgi:hypothetical protein